MRWLTHTLEHYFITFIYLVLVADAELILIGAQR